MCLVMIIRKELESLRRLPDGRRYAAEFIAKRWLWATYTLHNDNLAVHGFNDNRYIHLQFAGAQRTHCGAR